MSRVLIKPVDGKRVRDFYGRIVPEDGAIDKMSSWWAREERDGSVTISAYPKKKRATRKTSVAKPATEESKQEETE